jgi:hypothetical protein
LGIERSLFRAVPGAIAVRHSIDDRGPAELTFGDSDFLKLSFRKERPGVAKRCELPFGFRKAAKAPETACGADKSPRNHQIRVANQA